MNDMELFLEAINNMPDDIHSAKFDGGVREKKTHSSKPKKIFEETIDLHGMNKDEALEKIGKTLKKARGTGKKILVITGRGNNSEDGFGVIRDAVRRYLNFEGSKYIREYCQAPPKHGGEGALIVLT